MTIAYIYSFPILKIDTSDYLFIRDNIFLVYVNFAPTGNHIGIVAQYCEHHNMSYMYSQQTIALGILILQKETRLIYRSLALE